MNQHRYVLGWIYAILSFSLLLSGFYMAYQFTGKERELIYLTETIETQTDHLLSRGNNATFGHLESFLGMHRERNELGSLIQEYQDSFLSKTIWKNRVNEHTSRALQVTSGYNALYPGLQDRKDEIGRDNNAVAGNLRSLADLFNRSKTRINNQSDLSAIESFMAEAVQMDNSIDRLNSELERKKNRENGQDSVQRVVNNIYGHYTDVLSHNKQLLQQLRNALGTLSRQQEQQLRSLATISAEFNSNTGSVQLLYEQLYPFTRNMREWVDPVRTGIDAMNRPILPGITALSMLRQIDPLSAQTIVLMGELANQAVALDSEIQQLVANVVSLREIGDRFSSARTRANALRFTEQASGTSSYLQSKRELFDPIFQRLETANNQLNRLDGNIASVRNARARNVLHDLNLRSKLMVAQMATPIVAYREHITRSVEDLNQLVSSERTYTAEVQKLQGMEFEMADITEASIATVRIDNLPFHVDPMIFFIFIGLGFANLFVVLLILRKPKSDEINRFEMVRNQFIDPPEKKTGFQNLAEKQPDLTHSKSEKEDKILVNSPVVHKPIIVKNDNKDEAPEKVFSLRSTEKREQNKEKLITPLPKPTARENREELSKLDDQKGTISEQELTLRLQPKLNGLIQLPGCLKLLNGIYKERLLLIYGIGSQEVGLRVTIGRDVQGSEAHLKGGQFQAHIPLPDSSKTLSRMHLEIHYHLGELLLYNLSTSNPAMVGDMILKEGEAIALKEGSIITAGHLKMEYLLHS